MRAGQIGVSYGAKTFLSGAWQTLVLAGMLVSGATPARGQCLPQWSQRFDVPAHRRDPAMAFDSVRGVMVMIGGFPGSNDPRARQTWEWQGLRWILRDDVPVGPIERLDSAEMAFDSRRGVTVLRNHNRSNGGETWEYDGQTWTWISADGPLSSDFSMAYDAARGETLLWSECDRGTWSWDGAAWTHRTLEPIRELVGFEMAYDSAREVVVMFGYADGVAETWEWQGASWELRFTGGPPARTDHTMAYDEQRGVVVIHGGKIGAFRFDDTWTWNGTTWTQVAAGQPSGRSAHIMAYDALRGEVILFAGRGPDDINQFFNDTWAWDGQAWTLGDEGEPLARSAHNMTYDTQREVVVLFGGRLLGSSGEAQDTWEHDGTRWRLAATDGPAPRQWSGMAYDDRRMETLLFGGFDGRPVDGQTWRWDGNAWTFLTDEGPGPRFGVSMEYDAAREVIVLFGGRSSVCHNDTWFWDGLGWTLQSTSGPSTRLFAHMSYDTRRQVLVLFGGFSIDSRQLGDTWQWDGLHWTLISETGPPAREDGAMAYDAEMGLTVLFGGRNDDSGELSDTWTWDGSEWAQVAASGPSARSTTRMTYAANRQASILFGGARRSDTWQFQSAELLGDLNCDCRFDALDIEPFILALFDPSAYALQFPECNLELADLNQDGEVNALDIEPFIELLFSP